jgi:hypothetical protein
MFVRACVMPFCYLVCVMTFVILTFVILTFIILNFVILCVLTFENVLSMRVSCPFVICALVYLLYKVIL